MWILKSRRSRKRVLTLILFLLGTAIVAGTSMLGANLSLFKAKDGENTIALALLETMDSFDPSIDGPAPLLASAEAEFDNQPAIISSARTDGQDAPESVDPTADSGDPTVLSQDFETDPTTDTSDENEEEYAGAPGTPPAEFDTPENPTDRAPGHTPPFGRDLPTPSRPYTPSTPIVGLPRPAPVPGGGSNPFGGPSGVPTSPPILITAAPPSIPGPSNPPASGPGYNPSGPNIDLPQSPPAVSTPPPVIAATPPPHSNPPTSGPVNTPRGNPASPAPGPTDLGPTLAANDPTGNSRPADDAWYSPGHSPGIDALSEFTLGGKTLIIEFVSSEPGLGYDVLHVDGIANLDYGNIVFAFIDDYQPDESVMYEFLQAQEIVWGDPDEVNFFYGLIDGASTLGGGLHAPTDWAFYTQITDGSLFNILQDDTDDQSRLIDGVNYLYDASLSLDVVARRTQTALAPNTIPSPGGLMLLLSGGVGLLRTASRSRRG